MRHLHQDSRSVAGIGLATARAAMVQVAENLEGLLDDLMGLFSFDVHHEADATGFMLEPGIVQALFGRQPVCLLAQGFHFFIFTRHGFIVAVGRTSEIPR